MSSFKQRLGNALNQQLTYGQGTIMTPMQHQNDTSVVGMYGHNTTSRKSMNTSRISNNNNGSSVLSDRVQRISEKINEIHVSIAHFISPFA